MHIDLALTLSICLLVWLAFRIGPRFTWFSEVAINFLMSFATLLVGFLLYDIYTRLMAYEIVKIALPVLFCIVVMIACIPWMREYQQARALEIELDPSKKLTLAKVAKTIALVFGILLAGISLVLICGAIAFVAFP